MSLNRKSALAFAAGFLLSAAAAQADSVSPSTANIVDLGDGASALTYWVDGADGRQVVTTVDLLMSGTGGEPQHAIVRFSSTLRPGQTQNVSVPSLGNSPAKELHIDRNADQISITSSGAKQVASRSAAVD